MAGKKKRTIVKYRSYLWIDKDPILDALRTTVSERHMKYKEIHDAGGPTVATLKNWFSGRTRRPQFTTVAATTRTLGKNGIRFDSRGTPHLVD